MKREIKFCDQRQCLSPSLRISCRGAHAPGGSQPKLVCSDGSPFIPAPSSSRAVVTWAKNKFLPKYESVMVSGSWRALLSFTSTPVATETEPSWKKDPDWGGRACAGLNQVGCRQGSDPSSSKHSHCTPPWAKQDWGRNSGDRSAQPPPSGSLHFYGET